MMPERWSQGGTAGALFIQCPMWNLDDVLDSSKREHKAFGGCALQRQALDHCRGSTLENSA